METHSTVIFVCRNKLFSGFHQKLSMARVGANVLLFLVGGLGFQVLKQALLAFELEHVSHLGKAGS